MPSFAALKADITRELGNLERLVDELNTILSSTDQEWPARVRAVGSVLHDFYTALEKIFQRIARAVDRDLPAGDDWRVQLLHRMATPIEGIRPTVIDGKLATRLEEYVRFRHVFRHVYGFQLEREKCRPLAERLSATHAKLEEQINAFLGFLDSLSSD